MQSLQVLAEQRGLLPEEQDFVTAEEVFLLDRESEVFPELSSKEFVALVQSQGMDKADSDEDEEDDHKACESTIAQAVSYAEQMLALVNMRRELQRKQGRPKANRFVSNCRGNVTF
jgi:hypothetical protein